jgi:carbon monoxide dehydrogenase subunit G
VTKLHRTITVPTSVEEAFAYVADFSNLPEWDPGIVSAVRTEGTGSERGAAFRVEATFAGRTIPMTYRIVVSEPPDRVVLEGEGSTIVAVDDIRFRRKREHLTEIDYVADLNLKGVGRLIQPFLRGSFEKLADASLGGLEQRLS